MLLAGGFRHGPDAGYLVKENEDESILINRLNEILPGGIEYNE